MRRILRKLNQGEELGEEEYTQLLNYTEELMLHSPESYEVFYEQYASRLFQDYYTYIPRFRVGFEDLINYLGQHPEALYYLSLNPFPVNEFPPGLHPYLHYIFSNKAAVQELQDLMSITQNEVVFKNLPNPREGSIVFKYEDGNINKEKGLRSHFNRLGRYSFITRLQTYRYLTRNKAATDRFEYIDSDRLGGIFTNKEKSIYYLIFLTEKDSLKARNACELLNLAFYGRPN